MFLQWPVRGLAYRRYQRNWQVKTCEYIVANGQSLRWNRLTALLSNSSIGIVISAFNDLFVKIKRTAAPAEMGKVHTRLASIFGSSFGYVKQVLPNISLLLGSQQTTITAKSQEDSAIKNSSIAYILQQVLKVVSSKETPVMMFFVSSIWLLFCLFYSQLILAGVLYLSTYN